MVSPQAIVRELTDESLRFATVVGLVSIPFTVLLSGRPDPHAIAGAPLLTAGLIVGWFYSDRPTERCRAGTRAGLAASVGVILWQVSYMLSIVRSETTDIAAISVVLTPVVIVIGIGLSVLVATIGTIAGDWLATRLGRTRSNSVGN